MEPIATFLYPAAFGAAYVLLTFPSLPTTLGDLVRPLVAVVAVTIVVTVVLAALLWSRHRAAIVSSLIAMAISAPFLAVSAAAAGIVVVVVQLLRGKWSVTTIRSASAQAVSRNIGVFASGYLLVSGVLAAPAVIASVPAADRSHGSVESAGAPNIYLLLLDGYSRSDTLEAHFGHDNSDFERALADRGFTVAQASRSNYAHSWVTMTALLNGAHIAQIDGLQPPPETAADQFRALMVALNEGVMVQMLRDHGYQIAAIPPPFQSLGLSTADEYYESGQLTDFEYSLLVQSPFGRFVTGLAPDFLFDQVRDRFNATMSRIEALAGDANGAPRFLLAHLFSPPHAPLIYGRNGEELPPPDCIPVSCRLWEFPDEAWDGLSDQISYLNQRLIVTIDEVIANDPTGVVVLMADHGARRSRVAMVDYFSTFFAARTPGADVFRDDPDSVNVIRRLADAYLGTDLGVIPYESWYSESLTTPLSLQRFEHSAPPR